MTADGIVDEITRIPMSWDDYLALDDTVRGEYYEGALVVVPLPSQRHQLIQYELHKLIEQHLRPGTQVIQGWGWSPEGVREELGPDLMVHEVTAEQRNFSGVPDLVVEILSTNRRDDLVAKLNRYAQWGAPSYWIVDPRDHQILTHQLRDGYFVETGRFTGGHAELTYGDVSVPVDVDELLKP